MVVYVLLIVGVRVGSPGTIDAGTFAFESKTRCENMAEAVKTRVSKDYDLFKTLCEERPVFKGD